MTPKHPTHAAALPLEMRVYGLEGVASTQDEAITQQGLTLAQHSERLEAHGVLLAVQSNNQTTMQKSIDAAVTELVKVRWTLIGGAGVVAASCIGLVLGLG